MEGRPGGRVRAKEMDFGSLFPGLSAPSCVPHFHTVVPFRSSQWEVVMGAGETREERYWGSHHLRATETLRHRVYGVS